MFIELSEYLRCPADPSETFCVVLPEEMDGRRIVRGTIGCPATKREYPIVNGVADFTGGEIAHPRGEPAPPPLAGKVHALLGVTNPGGYIVCVGSAAWLAPELGELLEGVHIVGINAPPDVVPSPRLSLIRSAGTIPLRTVARGVVVGGDYAVDPWRAESARVLLRGMRVVVGAEVSIPGCRAMASEDGVWVGQKS